MNAPTDSAAISEAVARRFFKAWETGDIDGVADCFAEDAVYHNVPVQPIHGRAAIRTLFQSLLDGFSSSRLEVLHLAATPGVVLTERIDHFRMRDGRDIRLPVMGVFEVQDGRIRRFSDYFDLADWERQSGIRL